MRPSTPPTLSQIAQSGALLNQVPQWNGSLWVPATPAAGASNTIVAAPPTGVAATDTASLTAAFNAYNTAHGGRILLQSGLYALNAALPTLLYPGIVEGAGAGAGSDSGYYATSLDWGTTDFPGIAFTTANAATVCIRDLQLKAFVSAPGTSDAIHITGGPRFLLSNIWIEGFSRNGIFVDTITSGNADNGVILRCGAKLCKKHGLELSGNDSQNITTIMGDFVANGYWGIANGWGGGAAKNTFIGCHCASNGVKDIVATGSTTTVINVANGNQFTVGFPVYVGNGQGRNQKSSNILSKTATSITLTSALGTTPTTGDAVVQFGAVYDNANSSRYITQYIENDGFGAVQLDANSIYGTWDGSINYGPIQYMYPRAGSQLITWDITEPSSSSLGSWDRNIYNVLRMNSFNSQIGFLGAAPHSAQVSGGTLAGVITGLVNLGLFSS